jgi:hypothetical protein
MNISVTKIGFQALAGRNDPCSILKEALSLLRFVCC